MSLNQPKYTDLIIPDVGETGQIELLKWNFESGSVFNVGDELCDLITDKAAFSLEAPVSGTLISADVPAGSFVKSGQVVGKVAIKNH